MKNIVLFIGLFVLFLLISCTPKQQIIQGTAAEHTHHPLQKESHILFSNDDPTVKIIRMEANDFAFKPSLIEVNKSDKVRIIAKSLDVTHGIHLDLNDVSVELPPNEERIIDFIAGKPGTFYFHCSVYCGSGHDKMQGKLVVRE